MDDQQTDNPVPDQNNLGQQPEAQPPQQPEPTPPTQPQTDFSPPARSEKKSKKKILIAILFVLLLVAAAAGAWYFFASEDEVVEEVPVQANEQNTEDQNDAAEEETVEQVPEVYVSTLYPDFSFTVAEGWQATEPDSYDTTNGEGFVNGSVIATKNDIALEFQFKTVLATGFEGYSCYKLDDLTKVGDKGPDAFANGEYYRYMAEDGNIVYTVGVSEENEEWNSVIEDPDFTNIVDPNPNFCISYPYLGEYSSTVNQSDYDAPYGFNDNEKAMVFLAAVVTGSPDAATLSEIDAMVMSRSDSAEIL